MRLCMFHPIGHPMERGWVGRVEGDRVVQLAAQTLQSFFTGGGAAREHAEYPVAEVQLLAPVLHPPSVRVFDEQDGCAFANPAAIVGPDAEIPCDDRLQALALRPRIVGIVGVEGALAAFTVMAEWRDPRRAPPKDRDFALGLGPVAVTSEAFAPDDRSVVVRVDGAERATGAFTGFDWQGAVSLAAEGTKLYPGDLIAGPGVAEVAGLEPGSLVEIDVDGIGVLVQRVR
jgi:Fumarylacetoacetate (FAA) hydrolase family/Rv2993c-like, N-terminal